MHPPAQPLLLAFVQHHHPRWHHMLPQPGHCCEVAGRLILMAVCFTRPGKGCARTWLGRGGAVWQMHHRALESLNDFLHECRARFRHTALQQLHIVKAIMLKSLSQDPGHDSRLTVRDICTERQAWGSVGMGWRLCRQGICTSPSNSMSVTARTAINGHCLPVLIPPPYQPTPSPKYSTSIRHNTTMCSLLSGSWRSLADGCCAAYGPTW
jgi:hypothetical protein